MRPFSSSFPSTWYANGFAASHEVKVCGSDVRFGSKADISQRPTNVRFTRESGHSESPAGMIEPSPTSECRPRISAARASPGSDPAPQSAASPSASLVSLLPPSIRPIQRSAVAQITAANAAQFTGKQIDMLPRNHGCRKCQPEIAAYARHVAARLRRLLCAGNSVARVAPRSTSPHRSLVSGYFDGAVPNQHKPPPPLAAASGRESFTAVSWYGRSGTALEASTDVRGASFGLGGVSTPPSDVASIPRVGESFVSLGPLIS